MFLICNVRFPCCLLLAGSSQSIELQLAEDREARGERVEVFITHSCSPKLSEVLITVNFSPKLLTVCSGSHLVG